MSLSSEYIVSLVDKALSEDIGDGDITSMATIDENASGEFSLIAKQDMIVCGLEFFCTSFKQLDPNIILDVNFKEGDKIAKGQVFIIGRGNLRNILSVERVALNFIQYFSGIATLTNRFVEEVKDFPAQILDTRKILPLYRDAVKYAVLIGGGKNHRMRLDDAILIKDNHIKASGSINRAVSAVRLQYPSISLEVECETLLEVEQACKAEVDIIMLDNMDIVLIKDSLKIIPRDRIKVEVSGNVTLANVREIAKTGVDYISIGSLTHSVTACDISLNIS